MGYSDDFDVATGGVHTEVPAPDTGLGDSGLPATPSYLVAADNHQVGNTGSSILDPTTWGDRADKFYKYSVGTLVRATTSTINSAVTVGQLAGVTDNSDKVSAGEWLHAMDDDLGQYYDRNKSSIDTVGDIGASFIPGLAGIKVLNWAQRGLALAKEGNAGLNLARAIGTLPTKQAEFAAAAKAEIMAGTSSYSLINANLAKSLITGYAQNALEMAAFETSASLTMGKDSPLFQQEDLSDIAYNSLLGGGFIGAGIMGSVTAARTIMDMKAAGKEIDRTLHPYKTVLTEVATQTPASEKLAVHLNNIESLPTIAADDPLYKAKMQSMLKVKATEQDNGREAAHAMVGTADPELGNAVFNLFSGGTGEDAANKLAGVTQMGRAAKRLEADKVLADMAIDITPAARAVEEAKNAVDNATNGTTDYNKAVATLETSQAKLASLQEKISAARNSGQALRYISLQGEDAGAVLTAPNTLRLADTLRSESEVAAVAASYKHKAGQDWNVVAATTDPESIEARYITAQTAPFDPTVRLGAQDIPFLERAWQEMNKQGAAVIPSITLKGGTTLDKSALWHHLDDLKGGEALRLQESSFMSGVPYSNGDVAKWLNVKQSLLQGTRNLAPTAAEDLFPMQANSEAYTARLVAQGLYSKDKPAIQTWLMPSVAKVSYDTKKFGAIDGHELGGMTALKEQQVIYREQAVNTSTAILGDAATNFPERIPGSLMPDANNASVGGNLFTSMNAGYKTLAGFVQQVGASTAALLAKKQDNLKATFASANHTLLNDSEASTEFWKTAQLLRQTPEKYELVRNYRDGEGHAAQTMGIGDHDSYHLVNIKQLDYEDKLIEAQAAGKDASEIPPPVFEDTKPDVHIALQTDGMQTWARTWNDYHKAHIINQGNLRASQGLTVSPTMQRNFYIPPTDVRSYPHFAFVVDDSITGTGHISTIHANTAADLEALASKVPTEQGLRVLYKDQSERWHQAMKDYDYDLGINENYIDSALKRTGVSADYFPRTDSKSLLDELMQYRSNQDAGLVRDTLEHRYNPEFSELRRQGADYDLAQNSKVGYMPSLLKAKQSNPFTDYIRTALYQSREGSTPIWSAINRLAETGVSRAVAKISSGFEQSKSPEDLEAINKQLESIGCSAYTDAATYALANHTAPPAVLSSFIRKANGLLTLTMLRADPMNALNNGFGHFVLYGSELQGMIKDVMATGQDGVTAIKDLAHIAIPGTPSTVLSPAKLAASAYTDYFSRVLGKSDKGAQYSYFKSLGVLPNFADQHAAMLDHLALDGTETAGALSDKISKAYAAAKAMGNTLEAVTGNTAVEQMNRYVAAHTANAVADTAIAAGCLDPSMKASVINTFVNRTQGVTLAAQRPLLFKGAIGQAVGLFQTYQFNMLQQLFRHIGEGNTKQTATLLGLQGSIYGMNGLPAFNAMNQYLVGNAAGNSQHNDVYSTAYNAVGREAGDWLLYGISSNFLLNPDMKVNLYTRGDINPRQVTVIPTQPQDVPIIGATTKFFGAAYEAMQKIDKGADVWGSFLQGVEHSGVSRPLAGIAQTLEATTNPGNKVFSTTGKGNIVMQNDLVSAMTAARVLGAKPLDEAVLLDAYHRVTVYDAATAAKVENLGEGIKATVAGGGAATPQQITNFAQEYVKAGGKQQGFNKWYTGQVLDANKSQVNKMIENSKNPGSTYMQSIAGGYELSDFVNSNATMNGSDIR